MTVINNTSRCQIIFTIDISGDLATGELIYCFLATSISLIVVIISGQPAHAEARENFPDALASNHFALQELSRAGRKCTGRSATCVLSHKYWLDKCTGRGVMDGEY